MDQTQINSSMAAFDKGSHPATKEWQPLTKGANDSSLDGNLKQSEPSTTSSMAAFDKGSHPATKEWQPLTKAANDSSLDGSLKQSEPSTTSSMATFDKGSQQKTFGASASTKAANDRERARQIAEKYHLPVRAYVQDKPVGRPVHGRRYRWGRQPREDHFELTQEVVERANRQLDLLRQERGYTCSAFCQAMLAYPRLRTKSLASVVGVSERTAARYVRLLLDRHVVRHWSDCVSGPWQVLADPDHFPYEDKHQDTWYKARRRRHTGTKRLTWDD